MTLFVVQEPIVSVTDGEWAHSCKCRAAEFFKNRTFDDERDDDLDGDFSGFFEYTIFSAHACN